MNSVIPRETVRRFLEMVPLGFKQLDDFDHSRLEVGVKHIRKTGFLPVLVGQANGEAQRINLKLALHTHGDISVSSVVFQCQSFADSLKALA